jgi:protein translocase SecG subunit
MDHILVVLRPLFLVLQFIVSLGLVVLVVSLTPKTGGLGSAIGQPAAPNFKGKPGREEMLQAWTVKAGIAWFVVSILVGVAFRG